METYLFFTQGNPCSIQKFQKTNEPKKVAIELATELQEPISYARIEGDVTPIPANQLTIETRINNLFRGIPHE